MSNEQAVYARQRRCVGHAEGRGIAQEQNGMFLRGSGHISHMCPQPAPNCRSWNESQTKARERQQPVSRNNIDADSSLASLVPRAPLSAAASTAATIPVALRLVFSLVDADSATIELLAVEGANHLLYVVRLNRQEAEAA